MSKEKSYSLSFVPPLEIYGKCSEIINGLSLQYKSPKFEPHITLIPHAASSKEEVIEVTSQLAKNHRPFEIKLAGIEYFNEYFVCVFVRVEKSEELISISNNARKIFKRANDPDYMPHLSLLYGTFSDEVKKGIVEKLGRQFNFSFTAKSISIFDTTGKPEEWKRIKEIFLG